MAVIIDETNLKQGVLGLVIALVEIIRDTLRIQAFRRIESGVLTEPECERLGKALMDLDDALERIKEEQGIAQSVQALRDGLDDLVEDVVHRVAGQCEWSHEQDGE